MDIFAFGGGNMDFSILALLTVNQPLHASLLFAVLVLPQSPFAG
jgi:hypothetical protein